ncbi:MAG: hypothetical protein Q4Q62_06030 [Thermoplasmata archaeon]|nr:hypothetical protein [Thermoplasmata archaeon]
MPSDAVLSVVSSQAASAATRRAPRYCAARTFKIWSPWLRRLYAADCVGCGESIIVEHCSAIAECLDARGWEISEYGLLCEDCAGNPDIIEELEGVEMDVIL